MSPVFCHQIGQPASVRALFLVAFTYPPNVTTPRWLVIQLPSTLSLQRLVTSTL